MKTPVYLMLMTALSLPLASQALAGAGPAGHTHESGKAQMPETSHASDNGRHDDHEDDHEVPAWALARTNPLAPDRHTLHAGERIYRQYCAACHGDGFEGDGWVGRKLDPKPEDLVEMIPAHNDGDLAWRIEQGEEGMPPWSRVLTQEQIWQVITFLRNRLGEFDPGKAHDGQEHGSDEHDNQMEQDNHS